MHDPPKDPENGTIRIEITDVFDLHTVSPKDVENVVEEYLFQANELGFKALRIIHGRGIGVQREIVRAVLSRTPFVASFRRCARRGGWLGSNRRDFALSCDTRKTVTNRTLIYPASVYSAVAMKLPTLLIGNRAARRPRLAGATNELAAHT
jgi:hypothetical protein